MPITGPSSYIPTINEFLAHWASANVHPGAGGVITLAGGIGQSYLASMLGGLSTARDHVTDMGVDRSLAREALRTLVLRMHDRLVEFNGRVRADLGSSSFARILPVVFKAEGAREGDIREALRQMSRLWMKTATMTPPPPGVSLPLVLMGSYDVASFDTDRDRLRDAFGAVSQADVDLRLAREDRNDLQDRIYDVLKMYRAKLPTVFPAGDSILDSLPALSPLPGHTPDAVVATVVWDAAAAQARVTWSESTEADMVRCEVRAVAGSEYVTDDETVLAVVLPGEARLLLTDFALSVPGLTAGFKVYVILNTGNERGSEAVFVTRPV